MTVQEPWDEIMGPPMGGTPKKLDPPPSFGSNGDSGVRVAAASSVFSIGGGGNNSYDEGDSYPSSSFSHQQRWNQYEQEAVREKDAATAQAVYMAANRLAERESNEGDTEPARIVVIDDEYQRAIQNASASASVRSTSSVSSVGSSDRYVVDHETIRQEALRMLEVADADQNYTVHRTVTGGFTATPKKCKPSRAALSGLNLGGYSYSSNRKNIGRSYRDDPFANTIATNNNNVHYGQSNDDEENIVDVIGMERRSLASRENNNNNNKNKNTSDQEGRTNINNNWSSRYSIDHTLLAMTGGTVSKSSVPNMRISNDPYSTSNARILDQMDRENRANNANKGFFARWFSKHYVSLPASSRQPNLHSAFIDNMNSGVSEGSTLPPANNRTKTWQEQIQHRRFRNRILTTIGLSVLIFVVSFSAIIVHKNRVQSMLEATGSVTFYVTSDVPIHSKDESNLYHELQSISDQAKFVVHLGNIQSANQTKCKESYYQQVADFLRKSSPVTMFVLPGKEDWEMCPNPIESLKYWNNSFAFFNEKFDQIDSDGTHHRPIKTYHEKNHIENWGFIESGVLFIGVHVVGGIILDQDEVKERNEANFRWIMGMTKSNRNDIRSIVIFGHVKPGLPQNANFFGPLEELWMTDDEVKDIPTLYVHGSSDHTPNTMYQPFRNVANLQALSCASGSTSPPLRINVGYGENPFIIG